MSQTYCDYVTTLPKEDVHRHYHDQSYGFPLRDDNELFGRLILEINQAGLSWTTVLKKQANFRKAYQSFDIAKIARYGTREKKRLLSDAGIIRNRLKIEAAIANAKAVLRLQKEFGSFQNWLNTHGTLSREGWTRLFKKTFRFTGGEIVNEFLMSTGYLPGAHTKNCPMYPKILKKKPAWTREKTT